MSQTHEQLGYSLAAYDHLHYGRCPSQISGWKSRDPNCPSCVAMIEVDKLQARVLELEATEEGAQEAFGAVVQEKARLEAECRRLRELLESAHAQIRRTASVAELEAEVARLSSAHCDASHYAARAAKLEEKLSVSRTCLDSAFAELARADERLRKMEAERDQFAEAMQAAVRANKVLMDERNIAATALRLLYDYERWEDADRNREEAMNAAADALAKLEAADNEQPECSATNTPAAPTRQYFYKNNACQAADSADSDCICWHDEGTGPRHEESHGVRLRWREAR